MADNGPILVTGAAGQFGAVGRTLSLPSSVDLAYRNFEIARGGAEVRAGDPIQAGVGRFVDDPSAGKTAAVVVFGDVFS